MSAAYTAATTTAKDTICKIFLCLKKLQNHIVGIESIAPSATVNSETRTNERSNHG